MKRNEGRHEVGGAIPPACDGHSLLPFLDGPTPAGWRGALHYEYDFRNVHYSQPETELGLTRDGSSLCVIQDACWKYVYFAALPPLLFDLAVDPHQFRNLAADPTYAATVRDYARRALPWRMRHADRTLTHFRATSAGLDDRTHDERSNRG